MSNDRTQITDGALPNVASGDQDVAIDEMNSPNIEDIDTMDASDIVVPHQDSTSSSLLHNQLSHDESNSTPVPQVITDPNLKQLPNRVNRGIPKAHYEPVLTSNPKYPLSNFVSYHNVSKKSEAFMNQLSAVPIPNNVQEALRDTRWKEE